MLARSSLVPWSCTPPDSHSKSLMQARLSRWTRPARNARIQKIQRGLQRGFQWTHLALHRALDFISCAIRCRHQHATIKFLSFVHHAIETGLSGTPRARRWPSWCATMSAARLPSGGRCNSSGAIPSGSPLPPPGAKNRSLGPIQWSQQNLQNSDIGPGDSI